MPYHTLTHALSTIYSTYLLHESKCDMAKYFIIRLIYFHEPEGVKIKPESEISNHLTLMSIISGLFQGR